MKKLICICIITAIVLSAGIVESVLASRYFNGVARSLEDLSVSLTQIGEDDLSALEDKSGEIVERWKKYDNLLLTTVNHNTLKSFEDKLVSLHSWIKADGYGDALALCESAKVLADDLAAESKPSLSNMF